MTSKKSGEIELEKTFLESYNLYSDAIFRFILFKIDNREKALDLMQETFMRVWIQLSKGEEFASIKAFLYRVAGNLVIDEYRKRDRKEFKTESLEVLLDDGFEPGESVLEETIDRIDGRQVLELLNELPDIYRDVLFMKYTEEMTISEISQTIEVTENVVSVRLNRGLTKLKQVLNQKFNQIKT